MEDKRTALAIFLSIVIIIIYTELVLPKPKPATAPVSNQQTAEQAAVANNNGNISAPTSVSLPDSAAIQPADNSLVRQNYSDSPYFAVETDLYRARISLLGGRLMAFRLTQHAAELKTRQRLNLVSVAEGATNFPLGVTAGSFSDAAIQYQIPDGGVSGPATLKNNVYTLNGKDNLTILLSGVNAKGVKITKQFIFRPDSYLFDFNVTLDAQPDNAPAWIEWSEFVPSNLESLRWNPKFYEVLEASASVKRFALTEISTPRELNGTWSGIGDSYFAFLLINRDVARNTVLSRTGEVYSVKMQAQPNGGNFQIFTGPKDIEILNSLGHGLHKAVDLGYFAFVGEPILIAIHFLYDLLGNYGLAIILLTIVMKLLLLPLTKTSFKSMKAMQDLQPELQELRSRIKDPAQLQKEMMGLYQKRGVNPLGGCLPILLQMPIFLGMYNALQRSIDLRHADFTMWINDLSAPEALEVLGIKVPVMILLMGGSMLWQQITTPTTGDPAQKRIMYIVPFVFTIIFVIYPFPSGLVLYWLINNIISIIQQISLRSDKDANPLRATIIGGIIIFVVSYVLTLL